MRKTIFILLTISFVGCRQSISPLSSGKDHLVQPTGISGKFLYPEFAEESLSEREKTALEIMRREPVDIVAPIKFSNSAAKQEIYTKWFHRGYTFTKAKGQRHHHHMLYQNVTPDRRPIIEGWSDGQLHADNERIQSVNRSMMEDQQAGSSNGG